jgi:heme/copper-type cytochrome/quinol oxidase subunit 2
VTSRARIIIIVVAVIGLIVAFIAASGGDDDDKGKTASTTTAVPAVTVPATTTAEPVETTPAPPKPEVPTVEIKGGEPVGGELELKVDKGDTVKFKVVSDVADEIHVHGYDIMRDIEAGGSLTIQFKATIDGKFEIELEDSKLAIAELEVSP